MFLNKKIKQSLLALVGGIMLVTAAPLTAGSSSKNGTTAQVMPVGWKEYHAKAGNCSLYMPSSPEHISEKMAMPEEGFELKYDAYISAADQESVFMLLVAQYPDFVDEAFARMSLEGFLNGILTHNPGNQLLSADLLLVGGHEALDFHIRSGSVYFKGRAVMVNNSLYLMAMECEIPNYSEASYNNFVDSFKLHKNTFGIK